MDVSMSPTEIGDFLAEPRTAVLSTIGADGIPHSAGMWFVVDASRILMWTYAKSQKAVNLMRDPRCAFLVEAGVGYHELRGVLIRGIASLLTSYEDIVAIGRSLYDRYSLPFTRVPVDDGPIVEVERQARKRIGVSLPLERVASWDHAKLGGGAP